MPFCTKHQAIWRASKIFHYATGCLLCSRSCIKSEWALEVHRGRLPSYLPLHQSASSAHKETPRCLHRQSHRFLVPQRHLPPHPVASLPRLGAYALFSSLIPLALLNLHIVRQWWLLTLYLFLCYTGLSLSCSGACIMRRVYKVIYVALIVPHGRLVSGETPVAINDEFVLMHSPLQRMQERELICASLFHRNPISPRGEATN